MDLLGQILSLVTPRTEVTDSKGTRVLKPKVEPTQPRTLLERILSGITHTEVTEGGMGQPRVLGAQTTPTATPTATPTQPPVPTPTLLPGAPENPYMDLLKQYFPPEEVNNASNVMFNESGFRPDALGHNDGGTTDYGLFQINDYWQRHNLAKKGLSLEDLLDAATNIKYAAEMQAQQGWEPWYGADSLGLTSRSK